MHIAERTGLAMVDSLEQAVKEAATEHDGRLTLRCAEAFAIAESHEVTPPEVGRVCNENGIKIVGCQLGCF